MLGGRRHVGFRQTLNLTPGRSVLEGVLVEFPWHRSVMTTRTLRQLTAGRGQADATVAPSDNSDPLVQFLALRSSSALEGCSCKGVAGVSPATEWFPLAKPPFRYLA